MDPFSSPLLGPEPLPPYFDYPEWMRSFSIAPEFGATSAMLSAPAPDATPTFSFRLIGDDSGQTLEGTTENDKIIAGDGDDSIDGFAGDDGLNGGEGNDTVNGGAGHDDIKSGGGDDEVYGGEGNDTIKGGSGDDLIDGGDGDDHIDAGLGNDTVFGGLGNDTLFGRRGIDTAVFAGSILDFVFDPDAGLRDTFEVTDLNAADGDQGTDTLTRFAFLQFDDFTYDIRVNNGPLVVAQDVVTDEETPVVLTVSAYDFEGDALSIAGVTFPGTVAITPLSNAALVPVVGTGRSFSFTFNPVGFRDDLAAGASAVETLSVSVQDADGNLGSVDFDVTINGVNDAPVATDDAAATDEDTPLLIDVLANDTDVDTGDTLTITSASADNGTVAVTAGGQLLYTPNLNFNGGDTIRYEISDGNGGTDFADVTLTVNPINDVPVALNTDLTFNEADGPFVIDLNDQVSEVDGDTLTFSNIALSRDSALIAFTVLAGGRIAIDPTTIAGLDTGDDLTVRFSYTVTDDSGDTGNDSANGAFDLTIVGQDDPVFTGNVPPTANPITVIADEEDGPISIPISAFVTDPTPNEVLTITLLVRGDPASAVVFSGGVDLGEGGALIIDPVQFGLNEGEAETFLLTYVVEDSIGSLDRNIITLQLTGDTPAPPGNRAPVALNIPGVAGYPSSPDPFGGSGPLPGEVTGDLVVDLDDLISDPDGDSLTLELGQLVAGIDEATGVPITVPYSFDPDSNVLTVSFEDVGLDPGQEQLVTLEYSVSDGFVSTAGQIVVNFVNPPLAPDEPETVVIDFEEFAAADPSFILPVTEVGPLGVTGLANVVETDELDERAPGGLVNGQTTVGGDNVLTGTFSTTLQPVLNESDEPVLDERNEPIFEEVLEDRFALLAPGQSFGPDDGGVLLGTTSAGLNFPVPNPLPSSVGTAFDLEGLSLNLANAVTATVTITTYRIGVVETESSFGASFSEYYLRLVEDDSFDFVIDGATPAAVLNFEGDFLGGGDTLPENNAAFDDILAVTIAADDGTPVVLDDILVFI